MQSKQHDSYFDLALMAKDLTLFEESLVAAGTHNRIGKLIADVWRTAHGQIPGADHTEIYRAIGGETGASKKPG